ncbi:MAG: KTSC domain-containing protein [Candidatus Paceibacterota bacterium]|jgi:hypothetical protein
MKKIMWWIIGIIFVISIIAVLIGKNNVKITEEKSSNIIAPQAEMKSGNESLETSYVPKYIYVKYRTDSVDIANPRWEYLNTSESSFVGGAWYDDNNQYMIINLSGINYHYCGLPNSAWVSLKRTSSFGTYYNNYIKGNYDCRVYPIPQY